MYLASKYIQILHHAILLLFIYFVIWFVFSLILIYFFQWKMLGYYHFVAIPNYQASGNTTSATISGML